MKWLSLCWLIVILQLTLPRALDGRVRGLSYSYKAVHGKHNSNGVLNRNEGSAVATASSQLYNGLAQQDVRVLANDNKQSRFHVMQESKLNDRESTEHFYSQRNVGTGRIHEQPHNYESIQNEEASFEGEHFPSESRINIEEEVHDQQKAYSDEGPMHQPQNDQPQQHSQAHKQNRRSYMNNNYVKVGYLQQRWDKRRRYGNIHRNRHNDDSDEYPSNIEQYDDGLQRPRTSKTAHMVPDYDEYNNIGHLHTDDHQIHSNLEDASPECTDYEDEMNGSHITNTDRMSSDYYDEENNSVGQYHHDDHRNQNIRHEENTHNRNDYGYEKHAKVRMQPQNDYDDEKREVAANYIELDSTKKDKDLPHSNTENSDTANFTYTNSRSAIVGHQYNFTGRQGTINENNSNLSLPDKSMQQADIHSEAQKHAYESNNYNIQGRHINKSLMKDIRNQLYMWKQTESVRPENFGVENVNKNEHDDQGFINSVDERPEHVSPGHGPPVSKQPNESIHMSEETKTHHFGNTNADLPDNFDREKIMENAYGKPEDQSVYGQPDNKNPGKGNDNGNPGNQRYGHSILYQQKESVHLFEDTKKGNSRITNGYPPANFGPEYVTEARYGNPSHQSVYGQTGNGYPGYGNTGYGPPVSGQPIEYNNIFEDTKIRNSRITNGYPPANFGPEYVTETRYGNPSHQSIYGQTGNGYPGYGNTGYGPPNSDQPKASNNIFEDTKIRNSRITNGYPPANFVRENVIANGLVNPGNHPDYGCQAYRNPGNGQPIFTVQCIGHQSFRQPDNDQPDNVHHIYGYYGKKIYSALPNELNISSVWSPLQPEKPPLHAEQPPILPEQQPLLPEQPPLLPEQQPLLPEQQPLLPEQPPLLPEQPLLLAGPPVEPVQPPVLQQELNVQPIQRSKQPVKNQSITNPQNWSGFNFNRKQRS